MSCKRTFHDQDPDYDHVLLQDKKRLKLLEKDAKEVTIKKIENIIKIQFRKEIESKENEIEAIEERLYHTRKLLDHLRACIVANFYGAACQPPASQASGKTLPQVTIHPAVKKFIGKAPRSPSNSANADISSSCSGENSREPCELSENPSISSFTADTPYQTPTLSQVPHHSGHNQAISPDATRASRFKTKKRIVIGNVSKYIPLDKRQDKDQATHKWMVYVRGPREEPGIDRFVKKVWFFLHPTYRPNDLVEVSHPPFHLTRRGWGEFPVRVQLHFHDSRNKRIDIIHTLKLDKTFTGLQTLGAETVVDILIYKPNGSLQVRSEETFTPSITSSDDAHHSSEENASLPKNDSTYPGFCSAISDHMYHMKAPCTLPLPDEKWASAKSNGPSSPFSSRESDCSDSASHNFGQQHTQPVVKVEPLEQDEAPVDVREEEHHELCASGESKWDTKCISDARNCVPDNRVGEQLLEVKQEHESNACHGIELHSYSKCERPYELTTTRLKGGYEVDDHDSSEWKHGTSVTNKNSLTMGTQSCTSVASTQGIASSNQVSTSSYETAITPSLSAPDNVHLSSVRDASDTSTAVKLPLTLPGNGVAAFVKCVDKYGNFYLVPYAAFLKLHSLHGGAALPFPSSEGSSTSPVNPKLVSLINQGSKTSTLPAQVCVTPVNAMSGHSITRTSTFSSSVNSRSVSTISSCQPRGNIHTDVTSGGKLITACSTFPAGRSILKPITTGNSSSVQSDVQDSPTTNNARNRFNSIEEVMKHFLMQRPIVCANPDITENPYSCISFDTYFSWNIGKRRAAEWQRACTVQKDISKAKHENLEWRFGEVWSVKRILLWARRHGYSPLRPDCHDSSTLTSNSLDLDLLQINTYSDAEALCRRLEELNAQLGPITELSDSDIAIDVVNVDNSTSSAEDTVKKRQQSNAINLPHTPETQFVRNIAMQVGVELKSVEVSAGVVAPLVEEIIFSAMKQFMEDLLRNSLDNAFCHSVKNRCPEEISLQNAVGGICSLPYCDFLTNANLGKVVKSDSESHNAST